MNDDNVFAASDDPFGAPSGGSRDPAPLDLFPIFERAWRLLLDNLGTIGLAVIVLLAVNLASQGLNFGLTFAALEMPEDTQLLLNLAKSGLMIVIGLFQFFLQLGLFKLVIDLDRGIDADAGVILGQGGSLLWALLAGFIVGIATIFGFMLLVIPGIMLSLGLSMTLLIIVDKQTDALSAVNESWSLTDGYKTFLFGQALVMFVLAIVSYCVSCGLLLPAVTGFYACVQAVTYNAMLGAKNQL